MAVKSITATFKIEIYNGATTTWVDYTAYALAGTLNIDHTLNDRSVCTFTLYGNGMTLPSVGQKVRITDGASSYFGGQIEDLDYGAFRPSGTPVYKVQVKCTDYSSLLDRYYVTVTYENVTSGAIVKDLIAQMDALDQLDTTNVADGPVVAKMIVPTITIQDALEELSRETGYKYKVSYDGDMYWFERSSDDASWDLTDATAVTRTVGVPQVRRERSQYRNVQEVRGGTKVDDAPDYYPPLADDAMMTYYAGDKIYSDTLTATSINEPIWDLGRPVESITIVYVFDKPAGVGAVYTAGVRGSNTLFYYITGGRYLYLNESYTDDMGTHYWWEAFPAAQYRYVRVYGKFRSEASAIAYKDAAWCTANGEATTDTIAQRATAEGGSGIYKKIEVNERLLTVAECQAKANGLLKQYGTIPTIIDYTSDNWGDLEVGQYQDCTIYGLNKSCVVKSIKISDIAGEWLRAQVQLVGSERQGYAQYWRRVMGGQTTRMQTTYAVRPVEIATEYVYTPGEDLTVDDAVTATAITSFNTWGAGTIGGGAEWA